MQSTHEGSRDLLSPEELRAAQRKIADLTNRAFTWHNLSLLAAKVTLAVFFAIWFGTFWWMVDPDFGLFTPAGLRVVPQQLFYGLINAAIAAGLALACTVVPAIFWSSLIAQTPAAELMNKLYAKYGKTGFYVALIGAVTFTALGFNVFVLFWLVKPNVANQGMLEVYKWSAVSTFLAVVFPAWALNKTTPEQWIAGMVQAREVARLHHALAIEEMIGAAMLVRADALLHADLMNMTIVERAANNREVAALVATTERRINKGLTRIGSTFYALHGMAMNIQTGPDDAIVEGYRQLSNLLHESSTFTGEEADFYETYVAALPEVAPALEPSRAPERVTLRPSMPPSAVTVKGPAPERHFDIKDGPTIPMPVPPTAAPSQTSAPVTADGHSQQLSQTVPDSPRQSVNVTVSTLKKPSEWGDAYLVCREKLVIPFNVPELATAANVSPSTADRYRKAWLEGGYLEPTEVKGKYFWLD